MLQGSGDDDNTIKVQSTSKATISNQFKNIIIFKNKNANPKRKNQRHRFKIKRNQNKGVVHNNKRTQMTKEKNLKTIKPVLS
jgi:hypothetical protein